MNELDFMGYGFGNADDFADDISDYEESEQQTQEAPVENEYPENLMVNAVLTNSTIHALTEEDHSDIQTIANLNNQPTESILENAVNAVRDEDVTVSSAAEERERQEREEKVSQDNQMVIDGVAKIKKLAGEASDIINRTSNEVENVREYKNETKYPEIKYGKAAKESSFVSKLIKFLIVCCVTGGVFAVYSNSYMAIHYREKPTGMQCAFSWIMEFDTLPVNMTDIYPEAMGMGFLMGFGILGIIGLFIWLDSDAKKQSRVGHEHGAARLATNSDYKTYKNKFMEG